jgi:hypothetical protein
MSTATNRLVFPIYNYANDNWVHSNQTSKQLLGRAVFIILAPAEFITRAIDTIIGLGAMLALFCTLGLHKPTIVFSKRFVDYSEGLAAEPYANLLRAVNPDAKYLSNDEQGLITNFLFPLNNFAHRSCRHKNGIKRHVISRLSFALLIPACIVTRAVDGVIGTLAAILSLATLGKIPLVNKIAYRGLQAPGILRDIPGFFLQTINPFCNS